MDKYILEAKGIKKSFKRGEILIDVLKGINIKIPSNKITVVVGASGAGKSTLLNILGGLDLSDEGSIIYEGIDINSMNEDERTYFRNNHIGFVFQFHHLLNEFTAAENVALPNLIKDNNLNSAVKKATEILSIVGMSHRIHHKPSELSGGEQQRVAIARAIINNPKIIFADEPTGNLDSVTGNKIHELFITLRDQYNSTMLIVTHNSELIALADFVYEIVDGVIKI